MLSNAYANIIAHILDIETNTLIQIEKQINYGHIIYGLFQYNQSICIWLCMLCTLYGSIVSM